MKFYWSPEAEASATFPLPAMGEIPAIGDSSPQAVPLVRVRARTVSRLVLAAAAAFVAWRLAILWMVRSFDPAATVDVVLDDAYYYLQIAYNIGLHGRSTYDGVTSTNGYQPLWMALIVAIESVLRLDKKGLYIALQGLVLLTTALPLVYCLRRVRDPFYLAVAAGLLASYGAYPGVFLAGMETALFAPSFVALAVLARPGLTVHATPVSWVFALVVLIRVDAACLLAAYALPLGYRYWQTQGLRKAVVQVARFVAPAAAVLVLYGIANMLMYGEAVPISGLAKRLGAPIFSNWGILINYMFFGVPVLVVAAVLLTIELVWTRFEDGQLSYVALGMLSVALMLHYLFYAMFSGWIPWPWYFYVFALMMAVMAARLVEITLQLAKRPERMKPLRPQLVALSSALGLSLVMLSASHLALAWQVVDNHKRGGVPDGSFNRRNVADAMRFSESSEPLVVAIGDRAAGLGYWSPDNVQVFPLEGLVANKAYLKAREHGEGEAWVREQIKPRYLIVDRENIEPVRFDGVERYVVIEPMQGRVVFDHLMTYCFPRSALVRQVVGRDDQIMVLSAPAVRATFDLSQAETCTGKFAEHAERVVFGKDSLRSQVVGSEYAPELGGELNLALEHFDRSVALRVRDYLAKAP